MIEDPVTDLQALNKILNKKPQIQNNRDVIEDISSEYLATLPFPQTLHEFDISGNGSLSAMDGSRWVQPGIGACRPDIAYMVGGLSVGLSGDVIFNGFDSGYNTSWSFPNWVNNPDVNEYNLPEQGVGPNGMSYNPNYFFNPTCHLTDMDDPPIMQSVICQSGEVDLWGECYDINTTTTLNRPSQNLTGPIPPQIWQLQNLTYINLSGNNLTGHIPFEFTYLINLTELNLSNNQLTGPILGASHPNGLTNLPLSVLNLSYNNFSGHIPNEISNMGQLQEIYFNNNYLFGELPNGISSLSALYKIYLQNNYLGCNSDVTYQSFDECGVFGGDGAIYDCGCYSLSSLGSDYCDCNWNALDCNDECGGTAFVDDCGQCVGGSTGLVENYLDVGCGCGVNPIICWDDSEGCTPADCPEQNCCTDSNYCNANQYCHGSCNCYSCSCGTWNWQSGTSCGDGTCGSAANCLNCQGNTNNCGPYQKCQVRTPSNSDCWVSNGGTCYTSQCVDHIDCAPECENWEVDCNGDGTECVDEAFACDGYDGNDGNGCLNGADESTGFYWGDGSFGSCPSSCTSCTSDSSPSWRGGGGSGCWPDECTSNSQCCGYCSEFFQMCTQCDGGIGDCCSWGDDISGNCPCPVIGDDNYYCDGHDTGRGNGRGGGNRKSDLEKPFFEYSVEDKRILMKSRLKYRDKKLAEDGLWYDATEPFGKRVKVLPYFRKDTEGE